MGPIADRSIDGPDAQRVEWPVGLLRSVWSEQQHLLAERIDVIERATSALEDGRLQEDLRVGAQRAAHMLAGSLGIFGFQEASRAARGLERELARPTPERAPAVRGLLSRLPRTEREPLALRESR